MIVIDVKADNLYAFDNFHINFSYKKKNVNPIIENEFLSYCPTFRYKKFVMLMGANASGKTTIGELLLDIFNFIDTKEYSRIIRGINNIKKKAYFSIDFISDKNKLYHLETIIDSAKNNAYSSTNIRLFTTSTNIVRNDNYERCLARINKEKVIFNNNYIQELEKIDSLSWMFKFAERESKISNYIIDENKYITILEKTLKSLDPRITNIIRIDKDIFMIKYPHRNVIIENGEVKDRTLSSGTKEGIGIAHLVASIIGKLYGFYYCDEKFSHVHTEIEKTFISLMIDCLHNDEQLIMTSHNTDLLEMNLPKHSYVFLKRNKENEIECISASEYLKRNTDSLKCAVDNDVFGTSPNVELIYELKDLK